MENVLTPKFRVSYPKLFKAELNTLSGNMEYSLVALFPKGADLEKLKIAMQEAISAKWGADKTKWPNGLKTPFRSHKDRAKMGEDGKLVYPDGMEEGGVFMTLKTQQKPGVVNEQTDPIMDSSDFYAGCFAHATVRPYCYDIKGNRGVAFGLQNVQKVADGDPISGRMNAAMEFSPIESETTNDDNFDIYS